MAAVSVLHILRSIREHGPISRTSLQQITGLSWGTITNATRSLLNRRLIREERVETTRAGRKPVHLTLNRDEHCMIGLELASDGMRCIGMTPAGETLSYEQGEGISGQDANQVLDRAVGMIRRAMADHPGRRILGIGAAVPGAMDEWRQEAGDANKPEQWRGVKVRGGLEARLGMAVQTERNTNCLALVERWFGDAGDARDMLCICVGESVEMGILLNGDIFRGSEGKAGEFGHMTLDPDGPECACGDRGCVEAYCAVPAVLKLAGAGRVEELNMRARGGNGDGRERAALAEMGGKLGVAVANAVDLFDPERVVIAGKMAAGWEFFSPGAVGGSGKACDKIAQAAGDGLAAGKSGGGDGCVCNDFAGGAGG